MVPRKSYRKRVDLGKAFSKAISCAKSVNRMTPFFIINLVILGIILAFAGSLITFVRTLSINPASAFLTLIPTIFGMIAVFAIMFFISLYVQAGVIDNAMHFWNRKKVPMKKSLAVARARYWSFLGASLLIVVISMIVNMVPLIGWLLALIVSWFFVVTTPAVIVGKKHAIPAVQESYHIFMDNKWQTFLFWLGMIVLSLVFSFLAFIPLLLALVPAVFAIPSMGILGALQANVGLFILAGVITAFLLSYVQVFTESAKTFYYVQVKKR